MIDEYIEFKEYTQNLLDEDQTHNISSRLLVDQKMPNLVRVYDILYRAAYFESKKPTPNEKIKDAYEFTKLWVEGSPTDFDKLSKNNFSRRYAYNDDFKCSNYRAWYERNKIKSESFKEKYSNYDFELMPKNDQTYRMFQNNEIALINELNKSVVLNHNLRTNICLFFPESLLKEIKRRCLDSYPIYSASLFAGVIMLLGYYRVESERKNKEGVRILQEDFQNWIGDKNYIENWWRNKTVSNRKLGSVQSRGILGTGIFEIEESSRRNEKVKYIKKVNVNTSLIEVFNNNEEYIESEYLNGKGLILVDTGRKTTYIRLGNIFKCAIKKD